MIYVYAERIKICLTLLSTLSTVEPVGLKVVFENEGKLPFRVDEYCTFYAAVLKHQ
jgi:hypothetical protein